MGYYLADGIYPSWFTFVKTIPSPQRNKANFFATQQESAIKDVERESYASIMGYYLVDGIYPYGLLLLKPFHLLKGIRPFFLLHNKSLL